jgi:glutathione S-transferase
MTTLRLFLGNQRFSSWSMRPWLALRAAGVEFETIVLRFDDPSFKSKVPSAAAKVPVLIDGDLVVHESLAICEYVAEIAPTAQLWPESCADRSAARALASEMHAGFPSIRTECSMDVCRAEAPGAWPISPATRAEIARLDAIFASAGERGGPFLFGKYGIVDAMYTPVVTRFLSYGLPISDAARPYVDATRALPFVEEWYQAGARENELGWQHYSRKDTVPRDVEHATEMAVRWAEAWNRRDVEGVLEHFHEDVVFVSPRAKEITGSAEVRGKAALREYWTAGVKTLPTALKFVVERVEPAGETNTIAIRFSREGGGPTWRACEVMTFDPQTSLVIRGEAYYGA